MKAIRTVSVQKVTEYTGREKPKYKVGDYLKVYCGTYQDHCFYVKEVRYNHDHNKFEYLYDSGIMGGWYLEGSVGPASSRQGWHYDSQGYCDNPGRGY